MTRTPTPEILSDICRRLEALVTNWGDDIKQSVAVLEKLALGNPKLETMRPQLKRILKADDRLLAREAAWGPPYGRHGINCWKRPAAENARRAAAVNHTEIAEEIVNEALSIAGRSSKSIDHRLDMLAQQRPKWHEQLPDDQLFVRTVADCALRVARAEWEIEAARKYLTALAPHP